jgi:hypothetical protein
MPAQATYRSKGGHKDSAGKKTLNRRENKKGKQPISQTHQPFVRDVKRRIGQFGGAGEPPIKK